MPRLKKKVYILVDSTLWIYTIIDKVLQNYEPVKNYDKLIFLKKYIFNVHLYSKVQLERKLFFSERWSLKPQLTGNSGYNFNGIGGRLKDGFYCKKKSFDMIYSPWWIFDRLYVKVYKSLKLAFIRYGNIFRRFLTTSTGSIFIHL